MGTTAQAWRVLEHAMSPYVSEEAFKSMADADPFDQQEYREWKDEQDKDHERNQ